LPSEKELRLHDWIPDEEDDKIVPVCNLEEWTGISIGCTKARGKRNK